MKFLCVYACIEFQYDERDRQAIVSYGKEIFQRRMGVVESNGMERSLYVENKKMSKVGSKIDILLLKDDLLSGT